MDPFDDILPAAPAARARPGSKFMPRAKSKQQPRKETSISELATTSQDIISQNECHTAVASTLSVAAEESNRPQVELPKTEDASNSEMGGPQQVSAKGDTAALVDDPPSTISASEVGGDRNFTNFPKSTCEVHLVGFEAGLVTNFILDTYVNNGITQPVLESKLNDVTAPPTTCSTVDRMEEPLKNVEDPFLDSNKHLEPVDNSLQVGLDVSFKSASDDKVVAVLESNIHSDFNFGKEREVVATEFELDPFNNILPDPGARNAHKFQPKIKPRPRAGNKPAIANASSTVTIEKSVELPTSCTNEIQSGGVGSGGLNQSTSLNLPTSKIPQSTVLSNNRSLAAVFPSQLDSPNAMLSEAAVHNGTRDWPPSFGKSSGEAADIFSGLESLGGDFITQAASDTGKPALDSLNDKGAEENLAIPACSSVNSLGASDTTQVQMCPEYHATQDSLTFDEAAVLNEDGTCFNNRRSETEEVVDLNVAGEVDDVSDYQPMKAGGADPTSEIPVHEELMNAADSPTLADFLNADNSGENKDANGIKKGSTVSSSVRKRRKSSITSEENKGAKTTKKLQKQAARKPASSSLNEIVEDGDDDLDPPYSPSRDQLEENDDQYEVDCSSKKKRVPTSSKKKSVAKNGKKSQKRKNDDDDSEKTTKEPRKKFSHSTRRKKRCVDKALLETPDDELRTLPIKDIILLAEYKERLAKKGPTTSSTPFTNQSVGDAFHETGSFNEEDIYGAYNNEEEFLGSEDWRDPDDDRAEETVPLAPSLFNYQSFMDKTPRVKWSKQDTELFYKAVSQFGTDFSMIQQLFPGRTRRQIMLKYKKEERQHPFRLSDAGNSRSEDHSCFKMLFELLKQASAKTEEDAVKDLPSDSMTGEDVEDVIPGTNEEAATTGEEVTTTKQDTDVKEQEDPVALNSQELSENSDDDSELWAQYKSDY